MNGCFSSSWISSLCLKLALDDWDELDTRSDIVNVGLEMLWYVVSLESLVETF